jgi:hypothetical protein
MFDTGPAEREAAPVLRGLAVDSRRRVASPAVTPPVATSASPAVTSPAVASLVAAVDAVLAQPPAELPQEQALADCAGLLVQVERLRAGLLGRVADVEARQLYLLDDAPSASTWVAQQHTSLDRGEVALARRLAAFPMLADAVRDGHLSVAVAERVGKALATLRRHVDRPDGLIDGQDGEQAVSGVVANGIRMLVGEALGGVEDDDPRLIQLIGELASIVEAPTSQLARLEAGFVLLARRVEAALLPDALGRLVDALLPNVLEKKAADGYEARGFTLTRKSDGSGFIPTGDLDLETGELLLTVLDAEMAVDPDNPGDTDGYARLRADGWRSEDGLHDVRLGERGPRSLRQRRHDALRNGLRRYLDSGISGMRDKVSPHLSVVVGVDLLAAMPGALPAVSSVSGTRLPASLVRSWACDSAITRFVLSLGNKVIETSHTARTLKPHERRAKHVETGGRCQVAGCRSGPHVKVVPHHVDAWSRSGATSLADTAALCEVSHHDLHVKKRTLRLRDGRRLNETGWVT